MTATEPRKTGSKLHLGIGGRIVITFCTLSVLVLMSVQLVELYGLPFGLAKGRVAESTARELSVLSSFADVNKKLMTSWLDERRSDAVALAQAGDLMRLAARRSRAGRSGSVEHLNEWLDLVRSTYRYQYVRLLDPAGGGEVAASTMGEEARPLNAALLSEAARPGADETIGFTRGGALQPARLHIIRQVGQELTDDGSPVLLLDLAIDMDEAMRPLLAGGMAEVLGRSGEVLIVDGSRRLLVSTRQAAAPAPLTSVGSDRAARLATEGGEGAITTTDYRGQPVLAAFRHIPLNAELAWGMVVKIDEAEALAPIREQSQRALLFGAFGLALTLVCSVFIARILGRPLQRMARTATAIERGDLTLRVPLAGPREISELGSSFNAMVDRLKQSQEGLEQRVAERTLQLEELNRELQAEIAGRAKAEEQFHQAQKLESVGRLAGGVAHDFNNMLSVIVGHAELCLMDEASQGPQRRHLEAILDAGKRSADITRQLLAFARRQPVEPKVLDLNATVVGMLRMLERLIGEGVELVWIPGRDLRQVRIDPTQVDQMLANLCVNARDAIDGTGRLTIRTANVTLEEGDRRGSSDLPPGQYVALSVTDTGQGMDQAVLEHLFEPFFTTKGQGKGTGLGLATVFGIVKQNKGGIEVDSKPGCGATFSIFLPALEAGETAVAAAEPEPVVGGSETILLVEDEESVIEMSRTILEGLGYRILVASGPEEALRRARDEKSAIDLLLTDVVMPGMNGRDLAGRLQSIRPGLRCLYMSGYTADIIADHGVLHDSVNYLQKPFDVRALAAKVRSVLEEAA